MADWQTLGSVEQEHDGWWWYPTEGVPEGPFGSRKGAVGAAQAAADEAAGNLVFRDKDGTPVAVLDTSNLN